MTGPGQVGSRGARWSSGALVGPSRAQGTSRSYKDKASVGGGVRAEWGRLGLSGAGGHAKWGAWRLGVGHALGFK